MKKLLIIVGILCLYGCGPISMREAEDIAECIGKIEAEGDVK